MFMFHLSLMAALAVFAGGMLLLDKARREPSGLLRFTGIVLIVGSIASAACSTYYAAKYHFQGGFDSPCPHRMGMHGGGKGMMMRGGMMGGMGMMGRGPAEAPPAEAPPAGNPPPEGHEQHH
jgi:hypothetical protein